MALIRPANTYDQVRQTYLIGAAEEIVDRLVHATSDPSRVDRFIFTPFNYDPEQMDRLVEDVLLALREVF